MNTFRFNNRKSCIIEDKSKLKEYKDKTLWKATKNQV